MAKRKSKKKRQPQGKTSPETLYRQGAEAFRRGDYEMAIAAWRRLGRAQRDPAFTAAFAEACFRRGLKGHLDSLRQAASLEPDEPRYAYHLALVHHRAGRPKEAEPVYRQALKQARKDERIGPRAAYALGVLLLETGRRPGEDPMWQQLERASAGSPWAEVRERLAWAQHLLFTRGAPPGPAPDPLWDALACGSASLADPARIDPSRMKGTAAAVAHSRLGARAWEQGDLEDAFDHWQAAVAAGLTAVSDNLFAAARALATERLQGDDALGALQAATAGLAVEPGDNALRAIAGQAHFRLGRATASASRWNEAFDHWQAALTVGGERSRRLVINLALAEEQLDNWVEAAELWREALRRRPRKSDHPDALDDAQVARLWLHVAESYRRVGEASEALNAYRTALRWAPDDRQLRLAYVDALLDDGRIAAADNQLADLLAKNPGDVELLDRRAQVYMAEGHVYGAVAAYEQILAVQPDHPTVRKQLARNYETLGDNAYEWRQLEAAIAYYQQGLDHVADDGMLLVSIGMCHLDLGAERLGAQFFERAYTAEPTNPGVYMIAAETWLSHNRPEEAARVIQRAEAALDLSAFFFFDLADYCYNLRRDDLAREYVTRVRTLAADDAHILVLLAERVGRSSDLALAQEIIGDALKLDPDHGFAYVLQGLILVLQGDIKAARHSWKRAERIAREKGDDMLMMALEGIRFTYDPGRAPPLSLLQRLMGPGDFGPGEWYDDEDWDF